MDASIAVACGADGTQRKWESAKVKDEAAGQAYPFELRRIVLGLDEDGDEISSCVVEPAEAAAESIRRASVPGGGNMHLAYDAVCAALKDSSNYGKEGAPITRPCVELETAITAAAVVMPCDEKRRRERAQLAITNLVGKGNFLHRNGWLWLP